MGLLKNKEKQVHLREKEKKIDIQAVLSHSVIVENKQALLGMTTASVAPVTRYVNSIVKESEADVLTECQSRINAIITDEVIIAINNTLQAQKIKLGLEEEIRILKVRISNLTGDYLEKEMNKMSLEIEIDNKEDELKVANKIFLDLYREALKNTDLTDELFNIFDQVKSVENDIREELNNEIELAQAKFRTMQIMLNGLDAVNDADTILDSRLGMANVAKKIIKASQNQVPLIKVLIK